MQVSQILPHLKQAYRHRLFGWLKWAIFLTCCAFVVVQIRNKDLLTPARFLANALREQPLDTAFLLLLLPLNWGLEARKWQLLARAVEPTTFWDACRAILSGLALGMAAPQSAAEVGVRLLHLRSRKRIASVGAWMVGNYSQMAVTGIAGWSAWLYAAWRFALVPTGWWWVMMVVTVPMFAIVLGLWYGQRRFHAWLLRHKLLQGLWPALDKIGTYETRTLHTLMGLTVLRYATFTTQFAVVFHILLPDLPMLDLLSSTALVMLAKSLIPAFNLLGDLGVREFSALVFFSWFNVPEANVVVASLVVWTLNLLLPSLVGLLFIFSFRFLAK